MGHVKNHDVVSDDGTAFQIWQKCLGLDKRIRLLYLIFQKLVWTRSDATTGTMLTETYEKSLFDGGY